MIELPDFSKAIEYENAFYLSCVNTRFSKLLSHYELYKMTAELPGDVVECGVFKGCSFVRFAAFRELLRHAYSHRLIGFDTFGKFPETNFEEDKKYRKNFVGVAGDQSISTEQLTEVLENKGLNKNIELVPGDITRTVPKYVAENPNLKISLLNMDTDVYEPAMTILEHLFPKIVKGGILILDDYAKFPGETKAADEFFKDKDVTVKKFPFAVTPCYLVKNY